MRDMEEDTSYKILKEGNKQIRRELGKLFGALAFGVYQVCVFVDSNGVGLNITEEDQEICFKEMGKALDKLPVITRVVSAVGVVYLLEGMVEAMKSALPEKARQEFFTDKEKYVSPILTI